MTSHPEPADDLQFDKAQYVDKSANLNTCHICGANFPGEYFKINASIVCPTCKSKVVSNFSQKKSATGILKALLFGIPAAFLGAVLYYAIVMITKYEIGLVALVIAWMVGVAVRKGSDGRGGLPYQIIAVILTYLAISSFYFPYIFSSLVDEAGSIEQINMLHLIIVFSLSLATPFMMGFKNIFGLVIIGFAVYEAWRINQKSELDVSGPFHFSPNPNA